MIKKVIKLGILGFLIYVLFLIELAGFYTFPFLLIILLLINLLEDPKEKLGIFSAFFVGLFWDIYSPFYIGQMALILPIAFLLLKVILFKYVRIFSISWIPKI